MSFTFPSCSSSPECTGYAEQPGQMLYRQCACITAEELVAQEAQSFKGYTSEGVREGDSLSSKLVSYRNRKSLEQKLCASAHKLCRNMRSPWKIVSQKLEFKIHSTSTYRESLDLWLKLRNLWNILNSRPGTYDHEGRFIFGFGCEKLPRDDVVNGKGNQIC